MNDRVPEANAVHTTASPTRRLSLLGLAGAVIAATVAGPAPARARKAGKQAKKTCKRQVGACESSVNAFCAGVDSDERELCETLFLPCCGAFQGCDGGAAYQCLIDARISLVPPDAT